MKRISIEQRDELARRLAKAQIFATHYTLADIAVEYFESFEPAMLIGDYVLQAAYGDTQKNITIYHKSGEGGDFSKEELVKTIDKFYQDNF